MKKIVVLDGSLNGRTGNTGTVVTELLKFFEGQFESDYIDLKNIDTPLCLADKLRAAEGFIVATGTYWQSWGSPLQRFFEETTDWEGSDIWLGKPACVVVTMHSIGGMGLIARLQSNLSLLGAIIPPQCCIAHSYINQEARKSSDSEDIWDLKYLPTIAHNLREAIEGTHRYTSWVVDKIGNRSEVWVNEAKGSTVKAR